MAPIFVVVDDHREGEAIERLLQRYRAVATFTAVRDAVSHARKQLPIGLVVGSSSGNGSVGGCDELALEIAECGCPVAAIGSDRGLLGAMELRQPLSRSAASAFLRAVFAFDYKLPQAVAEAAFAKAAQWRLTLKQVDILLAHIAGARRDSYTAKRGVAPSTYRVQVTDMLAKAAVGPRMDHVVMEIMRTAAAP